MTGRRRSTRLTGSRASSVVPSDVTATPRRSTRTNLTPSPLPLVNPRESTAYGSGIAALPTAIGRRAHAQQDLTEVFAGILGPVHEQFQAQVQAGQAAQSQQATLNANGRDARSRGRGSALPTPPAGRGRGTQSVVSARTGNVSTSFALESGMNSDVDLRPSKSGGSSARIPVVQEAMDEEEPEEDEPVQPESESEELYQVDEPEGQHGSDGEDDRISVIHGREGGHGSSLQQSSLAVFEQFLRLLQLLVETISQSFQWIWSQPIFLMCMVFATVLGGAWIFMDFSQVTSGPGLGIRLADVRHSVGQFATSIVAVPLASLNDVAIKAIGVKVDGLQDQINHVDSRSVLTDEAVSQIERILQGPILLTKDEDGNPEIPLEFWNELKRRLILELPHLSLEKYEFYLMEKKLYSKWDEWNVNNRVKMRGKLDLMLTEELEEMSRVTERALYRQDEIIKLIENKWAEIGESLYPQMREIHKTASTALRDSGKAKDLAVNMASQVSSGKFFAHAQNIAMADYHIQQLADKVSQRVNHFSPLQGAVISPGITSPSYDVSKERANFFVRFLLSYPSPNPPIAALTKWDEAGECWCASNNRGGQFLGVLLAHDLIPDEIVIEHVPKTATLDPGAMPKHMEMYVRIQEQDKLWAYHEQSELQFPEKEDRHLNQHWVRIAEFTYDKDGTPTQHFPIVFTMKPFVSVRHVAIRVLDNWGDTDHTCLYRVRLHGEVAPIPDSDEKAA